MAQTYTYSISADVPAGQVDINRLWNDIATSDIVTALDNIKVVGDVLSVIFKAALSTGDKTLLDNDATAPSGGIIGAHTGAPLEDPLEVVSTPKKAGARGESIVVPRRESGGGERYVTHNFCDLRTWWQESENSAGMTCTQVVPSASNTVYNIDDPSRAIIDLRHGRMVDEDSVTVATVAPNGNTMTNLVPTVTVGGVARDQALEDSSDADGYAIDYENFTITFQTALADGTVVVLDCRRIGTSDPAKYTFMPPAGYQMTLEDLEVDVSEDIDLSPQLPLVATTWASHPVITGGAVVPVKARYFKSFHDLHAPARAFYGPIPAGFGGSGGVSSPKWTFQWDFLRADVLYTTPNWVHDNLYPGEATERSVTLHRIEVTKVGGGPVGGSILTMLFVAGKDIEGI